MKDYKAIFDVVESSLISEGSKSLSTDVILKNLNSFKRFEDRTFSDAEYFSKLVALIFYSGFRAATVTDKLETIHKHFPDYETVSGYDDIAVNNILSDEEMIRNRRKIQACVANARTFKSIISEHISFQKYIESFAATSSFENLMLLKEELEYRFDGIGIITTYHFLTDIGMPVLKPDRVICRIFQRLGLIENEQQLLKTIIQGRKFAQATGYPIRYIDIVFVAYGQVQSNEFGIVRGICLETNPSCSFCGAINFCNYPFKNILS